MKTPVSSIQGYLETILNNPNITPATMHTFLERSYAQSNRLTILLRDISVLTRMDEAPHLVEIETVNLSKLIENMLNEVALGLEEKQIKVVNKLPFNLILTGNNSLIYSIFRNLMDNAIAYAGTNITVTINCFREDEKFYYFSFSDTGVGVPEEHLNRLFERFYRIDKGRQENWEEPDWDLPSLKMPSCSTEELSSPRTILMVDLSSSLLYKKTKRRKNKENISIYIKKAKGCFQLIIKQLKAALFFIQNFSISSSKLLDIFLKIVQMLEKFVRKITETS